MPKKVKTKDTKETHDSQSLVQAQAKLEVKLREIERKYYDLLKHLPVGVYHTTPDGKLFEANQNLADLLGFESCQELVNINVSDLYVDKKDREKHLKKLEKQSIDCGEFKLKRKDGTVIWGRDYPRAVVGADGEVLYYAGILVDITLQREAEEQLHKTMVELEKSNKERQKMIKQLKTLSLIDDLTGLYNRRGFFEAAKHQIEKACVWKQRLFLLFVDMDNLKWINDTYGHNTGDMALTKFAEILKNSLRKSDVKGRLGGDEFAVVARETSRTGLDVLTSRFKNRMNDFNRSKEYPFILSASLGVAYYDPEFPCSVNELLLRADKLMYEAKMSKTRE